MKFHTFQENGMTIHISDSVWQILNEKPENAPETPDTPSTGFNAFINFDDPHKIFNGVFTPTKEQLLEAYKKIQLEYYYPLNQKNMSDFKLRLVHEKSELSKKIEKLDSFLDSENFSKIDVRQQELLTLQIHAMKSYEWALNQRLNLL